MEPAHRLTALVGKPHASVTELLAARCAATPDATFVLHEGRRTSYAQMWTIARRFAGFLEAHVGQRPRVAVYLTKRPEAVWAWFGTVVAGGIHVALHRAHKGEVLEDLARRTKADLLVTEAAALETMPRLDVCGIKRVLFVDSIPDARLPGQVFGWGAVEAASPGEVRASSPADTVCLLYTSGTTGRSKAAQVPHNMYARGAANLAAALDLTPKDVMHDWAPLSHVGGQLHMTLGTAIAGGCLAMHDTFSRSRFWEQIGEARATCFFGFSNVISLLMMAPESSRDREHTLRLGIVAHMQAKAQEAFQNRFGVRLADTYGMSECEPVTLPTPDVPLGCSGAIAPDFEVAIADDEDRILPPGKVGRVLIRPRVPYVMMKGYEDDDDQTVEAWRNMWFHTQDLARLDERGFFWYVDRLKHSIRRGGENISSVEVERTLKAHPDVHDCAVVGVPDPLVGEAVKAIVVARPGTRLDPGTLHAFAAANMARFMVPRYVEVRDTLPYTDVGKVKRDELREIGPATWDADRK